MNLNIYISTCDTHIDLMKPFSYLFNKFWDDKQKVNVLGYQPPNFDMPDNFNFISMGKSTGNPKEWAGDLYEYFKSIDDKHFIFGIEDFFIPIVSATFSWESAYCFVETNWPFLFTLANPWLINLRLWAAEAFLNPALSFTLSSQGGICFDTGLPRSSTSVNLFKSRSSLIPEATNLFISFSKYKYSKVFHIL